MLGGKPLRVTKTGRALPTLPLDYVAWTERVAAFASRDDLLPNKPIVMVAGDLSPKAREEMQKLGWEVKEAVPLAGAF